MLISFKNIELLKCGLGIGPNPHTKILYFKNTFYFFIYLIYL